MGVKSQNTEMSEVLNKLSQTCYDTSSNSSMGDLLKSLMVMLGKGNDIKVVGFKPHRFLGMTGTMECVLDNERTAKHIRYRKRPPPGFPLAGHHQELVQLLSVLTPIILVTKRSQGEDSNQVQVLLSLYTVRMTALSLDEPIRRYDTTPANAVYIQPYQLTALVANTRLLLQKTFYRNFFRRYVDASYLASGSYVFEMQFLLHPIVKHVGGPMDEVVELVARTEGKLPDNRVSARVAAVRAAIMKRLKAVMCLVASEQDPEQSEDLPAPVVPRGVFAEDIMAAFSVQPVQRPAQPVPHRNTYDGLIANELKQWFDDPSGLQMTSSAPEHGRSAAARPETVLEFWHRQQISRTYVLLSLGAWVVFAVPVSSAQLERDFGNSGQVNRSFADVCQCPKLHPSEVEANVPSNVKENLEPAVMERIGWHQVTQDCFSMEYTVPFASDNEDESKNSMHHCSSDFIEF
ncbi:hypothetical protein P3T76_007321 [Phytophthora citrophthora]|uniref:HAT C-terminal dimerisation domain-containing protein n=1 Tax=Phytophthora citrophthora TaxID=4793 RepID=A0AAD9GMQ5_9STRA|nr:hypothetical protein P3T76_007321 [Phytophthora citrophthora]